MNKRENTINAVAKSKEALNEMYATLNNSEKWHKHKSLIITDLDKLSRIDEVVNYELIEDWKTVELSKREVMELILSILKEE